MALGSPNVVYMDLGPTLMGSIWPWDPLDLVYMALGSLTWSIRTWDPPDMVYMALGPL